MANLRERIRGVWGRTGAPASPGREDSAPPVIGRDSFAEDSNEFALAIYSSN